MNRRRTQPQNLFSRQPFCCNATPLHIEARNSRIKRFLCSAQKIIGRRFILLRFGQDQTVTRRESRLVTHSHLLLFCPFSAGHFDAGET